MSMAIDQSGSPAVVAPKIGNPVLYVAAAGFALWSLGWIVLIPEHASRLGWTLEVVGPLLIAAAIIMFVSSLVARLGMAVVVFAAAGAIVGALSTIFFAIDPKNLSTTNGVRFGYGAYAAGLLLGAIAFALVLLRKETELSNAENREYPPCGIGCPCGNIIHSSFASIALSGVGLLVWGIGFIVHAVHPQGTSLGWVLSVVGALLLTVGIAVHTPHLAARFGTNMVSIGLLSVVVWLVGYLLNVIKPNAAPTDSWYTYLFLCYAIGHLLSAVSVMLVVRRKATMRA